MSTATASLVDGCILEKESSASAVDKRAWADSVGVGDVCVHVGGMQERTEREARFGPATAPPRARARTLPHLHLLLHLLGPPAAALGLLLLRRRDEAAEQRRVALDGQLDRAPPRSQHLSLVVLLHRRAVA